MTTLFVPEGDISDDELARFLVDLDAFVAADEAQAGVDEAVALLAGEAEFDESKHPRDEAGKFTYAGSDVGVWSDDQPDAHQSLPVLRNGIGWIAGDHHEPPPHPMAGAFTEPASAAFVAEHGREYQTDAHTYDGPQGEAHACYQNAGREVLFGGDGRTYVEGYVLVHGCPVQHAWYIDEHGAMKDPTIRPDPGERLVYFGVPFTTDYIETVALRTKVWGIVSSTNRDRDNGSIKDGIKS